MANIASFDDYEEDENKYSTPKDKANDPKRKPHINSWNYKILTEKRYKPGQMYIDDRRAGEWDPEK